MKRETSDVLTLFYRTSLLSAGSNDRCKFRCLQRPLHGEPIWDFVFGRGSAFGSALSAQQLSPAQVLREASIGFS